MPAPAGSSRSRPSDLGHTSGTRSDVTPDDVPHAPRPGTPDRRAADRELLARRAALGDRDAFDALAADVGPGLLRHARRMLRDPAEAEDCVQDTLLAAWTGLPGFRGGSAVTTWLFAILTRQVGRRGRRRPPLPVDTDDPAHDVVATAAGPADRALALDLRTALEHALDDLPDDQRETWLLVTVEQLSYQEAAQVQRTTATAVRGRLERARRTLQEKMEAWR